MKYYETKFEEYIQSEKQFSLHPELGVYKDQLPNNIRDLKNIFIYGPSGTGKYTQALSIISQYSPSQLKYYKLMNIENEKKNIVIQISDIHYEVDMDLLGCHAKILWHDIFFQIVDIITSTSNKSGIILCKNFQTIHTELLEIFYNYIHHFSKQHSIHINFLFISEQISYVPDSITSQCQILSITRPLQVAYNNIINKNVIQHHQYNNDKGFLSKLVIQNNGSLEIQSTIPKRRPSVHCNIDTHSVNNIKELKWIPYTHINEYPSNLFEKCFNHLVEYSKDIKKIKFLQLRELLYDLLTYDIDIYDFLFEYTNHVSNQLSQEQISNILTKTYSSLKYYNNNYRPIYHLENMVLYIINCCYQNEQSTRV
jgi:hypothetical protein